MTDDFKRHPGPWKWETNESDDYDYGFLSDANGVVVLGSPYAHVVTVDGDDIADAIACLPSLLAERDRLRKFVEYVEQSYDHEDDCPNTPHAVIARAARIILRGEGESDGPE